MYSLRSNKQSLVVRVPPNYKRIAGTNIWSKHNVFTICSKTGECLTKNGKQLYIPYDGENVVYLPDLDIYIRRDCNIAKHTCPLNRYLYNYLHTRTIYTTIALKPSTYNLYYTGIDTKPLLSAAILYYTIKDILVYILQCCDYITLCRLATANKRLHTLVTTKCMPQLVNSRVATMSYEKKQQLLCSLPKHTLPIVKTTLITLLPSPK